MKEKNLRKTLKGIKKEVLKKAKIKEGTQNDNIKLGNMGSWAELFGSCSWYIPELNLYVPGTCGGHCKGCFDPENPRKSPCYVAKSYVMHTKRNEDGSIGDILNNSCTVKLGHSYRTIAMTMFRDELLLSLDAQLTRKRNKFKVIRINESGELTCYEDLGLWCELSRRHPETIFYIYTKNFDAVNKAIKLDAIPNNLFINISVWHESGIKEYKEMSKHQQIRAFVYVDKEWTVKKYEENGLIIKAMCPAYDENGKMNHSVTCDTCGKTHCYSRQNLVIGCNDH